MERLHAHLNLSKDLSEILSMDNKCNLGLLMSDGYYLREGGLSSPCCCPGIYGGGSRKGVQ